MLAIKTQAPLLPFRRAGGVVAAVLLALGCASAPCADAADASIGSIQILHPYARPTPTGAQTGGAYFVLRNTGAAADRLVAVSSPAAARCEIHEMRMDGGIMRMRALPAVELAPGARVDFVPGGFHLMLIELRAPLKPGAHFPIRLSFEKAGTAEVDVVVEAHP